MLITERSTKYGGEITSGTKESGFGIFTVLSHKSIDGVDHFGYRYEGEFKDNTFSGLGTATYGDKGKYVGEYKDGKRILGTFTFPDGSKYVGELKKNNLGGLGTATYPDGDKYIGEFKDGGRHGKGIESFGSSTYVGDYKNDERHGILIIRDSNRIEEWNNGVRIKIY